MNFAFNFHDNRPRHHVVVHHPDGFGCAIAGSLTADDLGEVLRAVKESHGYDTVNKTIPPLISRDCIIIAGTREGIAAWEAQLDAEAARQHPDDPIAAWMHSTRPGLSSMWMVCTLAGQPAPEHWRTERSTDEQGWPRCAFPDGAEAFRRCLGALELFERKDLDRLAEGLNGYLPAGHRWLNLLPRWDEMAALAEAERWADLERAIEDIGRLNPFGPRDVLVRSRQGGVTATCTLDSLVRQSLRVAMDAWMEAGRPDPAPCRQDIEAQVRAAIEADPAWEVEP